MLHFMSKIKEVGIKNCIVGMLKREKYKRLRKEYRFDSWHVSPYEFRKYVQATAEYINANHAQVVVDVGCGLGEMLHHINTKVKIGFDMHEEPIRAAKMLSKDNSTYCVGSFDEINLQEPIDYLVALNFMHGSTEQTWISSFHNLTERNDIRNFIVDTIPEGYYNAHSLNYSVILPNTYKLVDRIGPFLGGRFLEVYKKENQSL